MQQQEGKAFIDMERSAKRKRNHNFDGLKGIACIAVVFMHCEFPGTTGVIVQCLTRWAVPLFFAISGFFFRKEDIAYCLNKAKHIVGITLWASIFYVVFEIIFHIWIGDLVAYTLAEFSAANLLAFAVFNSPMFINGHLWFLFALIYVYLFCALLIKFNLLRYRKVLCIALMGMHFVVAYGGCILGFTIPGGLYRNFLLEGVPCFLIGNIVYLWSCKRGKEQKSAYVRYGSILICVGLLVSLIERKLLGRDFSIHMASILVLIGMLFVAVQNSKNYFPKFIVDLGRKYSMMIDILHPAVYMVCDSIFLDQLNPNQIYAWIRPVSTLILTIIISVVFTGIKETFKGGEVY